MYLLTYGHGEIAVDSLVMDKSSMQKVISDLTNQKDSETYDVDVPDEPKCLMANIEKVTAAGKSDGTKLTGRD